MAPDRLRFDFAHFQPVTAHELAEIERRVNAEIRAQPCRPKSASMGMQEALDFGAMALFGEKYGERVRVLRMGEFSTELCGGTHVGRTGDIGLFKIVSEGGVSAGVRRIEAVTGQGALDLYRRGRARLHEAAELLGGSAEDVVDKIRQTDRAPEEARARAGKPEGQGRLRRHCGPGRLGASRSTASACWPRGWKAFDAKALRDAVDRLKQQLGDAVIVLAGAADGKASLVAGVNGSARAGSRRGNCWPISPVRSAARAAAARISPRAAARTVPPLRSAWQAFRLGRRAATALNRA